MRRNQKYRKQIKSTRPANCHLILTVLKKSRKMFITLGMIVCL